MGVVVDAPMLAADDERERPEEFVGARVAINDKQVVPSVCAGIDDGGGRAEELAAGVDRFTVNDMMIDETALKYLYRQKS